MLLNYHRRLLLNLCRQALPMTNHIQTINNNHQLLKPVQTRCINSDPPIKRKILLKMNTVLHDTEKLDGSLGDSDVANVTCLNNELILSERMVKFPFHFRCLLEQQLAICQDRWVSSDEWQELYNIVGETAKPLFASITMLVCVQIKHIERGRSLFDFVQKHYPDLLTSSATACATYMNLLALDFFSLSGKKHGQDYSPYEKELRDVYEKYIKVKKQVRFSMKLVSRNHIGQLFFLQNFSRS